MFKYFIRYQNGGASSFVGDKAREGEKAFHIKTGKCTVLVPYAWYKDGEVQEIVDKADKFVV